MDAGLAAVCGALAGAVGAVGAAWATSRVQWKSARLAARAEHLRHRQDTRATHYRALISEVDGLCSLMISGRTLNPDRTEPFTEQFVNELNTAVTKVTSQITDVALAGPADVRNVAREIQRAADSSIESAVRLFIIRQRSPEARPSRREIDDEYEIYHGGRFDLKDTLATFTEAAAKALDDAGVDP